MYASLNGVKYAVIRQANTNGIYDKKIVITSSKGFPLYRYKISPNTPDVKRKEYPKNEIA